MRARLRVMEGSIRPLQGIGIRHHFGQQRREILQYITWMLPLLFISSFPFFAKKFVVFILYAQRLQNPVADGFIY